MRGRFLRDELSDSPLPISGNRFILMTVNLPLPLIRHGIYDVTALEKHRLSASINNKNLFEAISFGFSFLFSLIPIEQGNFSNG